MDSSKLARIKSIAPYVDPSLDRVVNEVAVGTSYTGRIAFLDEREEGEIHPKTATIRQAIHMLETAFKDLGFPIPADFAPMVCEYALAICADEAG